MADLEVVVSPRAIEGSRSVIPLPGSPFPCVAPNLGPRFPIAGTANEAIGAQHHGEVAGGVGLPSRQLARHTPPLVALTA